MNLYAQGLLSQLTCCASLAPCCLDVLPIAAVFSFLALLGGSCPAQPPWHSSCAHPSPSSCLGPVSWEGWSWREEWSEQQV